ncbi:hypothetical protein F4808DRAFT_128717 [Astrocystis sublimbata]|nr:hypothetical protein F4808DRAFT_128717 [Astrocystis sublimbata]
MRSLTWTRGLAAAVLSIGFGGALAQDPSDTGEHPDWPRWCGKVYEAGYPSFEPGGHTVAPPSNDSTFLHVQFKARHSIYLSTESRASFVVNAVLSPWHGVAYENSTSDGVNEDPFTDLVFSINLVDSDVPLVESRISINETGKEFGFDLSKLEPRMTPYDVVLFGASVYGDRNVTVKSEVVYLPDNPSGSATKIDNLHGGLLFKNPDTEGEFVPFLPYGYYGLYNGSNDTAAADDFVKDYKGKGLNAIISLAGFADTNVVYDSMDKQGLRYMFDLRGSYKNLTETETRVNTIKNRTELFAYWTADEPDGQQVAFDKTPAAQSLIHTLDPYHPVAITLNCRDYYFGPYSAGGDILMQDPYPIGINSTFSKWGTACNATLGDCGCDNCDGVVQDVSTRLDALTTYEEWLGRWPLPKFHNPQVFHGEDYWFRDPTAGEARTMNALAFNRGATGIFGWTWPGSRTLFDVHSQMASVVANQPVRNFFLGAKPSPLAVEGFEIVDAAYWVKGDRMLVSVVNGGYDDIKGQMSIALPASASEIESVAFGDLAWRLEGGLLVVDGLPAMSTSLVILSIASN